MKINIEATQEEFDEKREELIKSLAGTKLIVTIRKASDSKMQQSKPPVYHAQAQMLEFWNRKYAQMIQSIKMEVGEIIEKG